MDVMDDELVKAAPAARLKRWECELLCGISSERTGVYDTHTFCLSQGMY
jgi:hypothetical protein